MMGCLIDILRERPEFRGLPAQETAPGEEGGRLHEAAFAIVPVNALDLVLRAENQRRSPVQGLRRDVEDAMKAVDRRSARLFDKERDRVGLVEQAQAPMFIALARILRIE